MVFNKSWLAVILLAAACRPAPKAPDVLKEAVPMEWKGQFCSKEEGDARVVTTQAQWEEVWKAIGQPAPAADLRDHFAVAIFLGLKNTGGYGVAFLDPAIDDRAGTLTVKYKVTNPKGMAMQALTKPYAVKVFPKTNLAVHLALQAN